MNNVLNSVIEKCAHEGVRSLVDELLKLDPKEITYNVAEILNDLLKDNLAMQVDANGNAKITINLTAQQIKLLLQEISKQL